MSRLKLLLQVDVAGVDISVNSEGGIRVRKNPPPRDSNGWMNDSMRTAADTLKGKL